MKSFALVLASVGLASAHTIFTSLVVDGVDHGVGGGVRVPSYNGPIEDVTSGSMACNGPPNPTRPTSQVIDVEAGSTVTALWRFTLQTTGTTPADILDLSHIGPTIAYLKKVDDATSDTGVGDGWFKIQEDGLTSDGWGTEKIMHGGGRHDIEIPSCIESGEYLLRVELIALHAASNYPGAQFYVSLAPAPSLCPQSACANMITRWNVRRSEWSGALAPQSPRP